jgi:hypothetical protein
MAERIRLSEERAQTLENRQLEIGGEGGIRTLSVPLDSVSYRSHIAVDAVPARAAVAPCTLSHAGGLDCRHLSAPRKCGATRP